MFNVQKLVAQIEKHSESVRGSKEAPKMSWVANVAYNFGKKFFSS